MESIVRLGSVEPEKLILIHSFTTFIIQRDDFEVPEKMPDPPKLFRVQRFAPLRHRIYWERKILFDLGLLNDVCALEFGFLFIEFNEFNI